MMFEDVLQIELSGVLRSDISGSRAEMSHLREAVDADKDRIEALRGRKFHDEVHRQRAPHGGRDWQRM